MLSSGLILPGTTEALLVAITPRMQLKIRRLLRRLERDTDSTLVVLWVIERAMTTQFEYSGEIAVCPTAFPDTQSTVPSYMAVKDKHGDTHEAVIHRVRSGRGMPGLGLGVIDFGCPGSPALLDAVEDCGEQVAEIVVGGAGT